MEFTRDELKVVFQALCLADAYYQDPDRRITGMTTPTAQVVTARRAGLAPLIDRITRYAQTLSD